MGAENKGRHLLSGMKVYDHIVYPREDVVWAAGDR